MSSHHTSASDCRRSPRGSIASHTPKVTESCIVRWTGSRARTNAPTCGTCIITDSRADAWLIQVPGVASLSGSFSTGSGKVNLRCRLCSVTGRPHMAQAAAGVMRRVSRQPPGETDEYAASRAAGLIRLRARPSRRVAPLPQPGPAGPAEDPALSPDRGEIAAGDSARGLSPPVRCGPALGRSRTDRAECAATPGRRSDREDPACRRLSSAPGGGRELPGGGDVAGGRGTSDPAAVVGGPRIGDERTTSRKSRIGSGAKHIGV